jgi:nucleoid DNA-binding protein
MDFINFHIAYLLTKHECVIIPDFGAFIVSKVQDDKLKGRGFISPPNKYSLSFNPEIIQDDGLLVHSIEKEKNLRYAEALHWVDEYVDSLVDNLRTGQTVQFPWIGKIHLSDDRKIVFVPAKNLSCNASSCGLVNLNFPYLNETSEDESINKRKKIYKRPVFYVVLGGIVLLLALLFIFLILKPLDKNRVSLSDAPVVSDTLKVNSLKPAIDTIPLIDADSVKQKIIDSIKPAVADSTELSSKYYIIISSLTKETEAEVMLKYFLAKGLNKSKIIRSDGKYRISIETFDDQGKAIFFLDMLKKDGGNPLFREAWIFEETMKKQ